MVDVLAFHHALGRTPAFVESLAFLADAGHTVRTPDLFDGRVFDRLDDGVAHAQQVGFDEIIERGTASLDSASPVVVIGFSLGVLPAQKLAQTNPAVVGVVLAHACVPGDVFGDAWPHQLPTQIHAMDADPFFVDDGDLQAAQAIVDTSPSASLFLYRGDSHLFTEPDQPGYEAAAAGLMHTRVLDLLDAAG